MFQADKDDDAADAYSKDDIWKPPKKKKRRKSLEKKKSESRKHSQKTKSKKLKSNLKTKCVGLLRESQKEEDKSWEENNEPKASENVKPKTLFRPSIKLQPSGPTFNNCLHEMINWQF